MLGKIIGFGITLSLSLIGAIWLLGMIGAAIEGIGDWQVEHERCLKHAANALEARRCR